MAAQNHAGRHRPDTATVFVDSSGGRVRLARRATHTAIGLLMIALVAVGASLLGNVPLPGVRPPASLPGDNSASKHAPTQPRSSQLAAGASSPSSQGATPGSPATSGPSAAHPTTAPTAAASTPPGQPSSLGRPTTTPSNTTAPTSGARHGQAPITPPGQTKKPTATKTP
jgi:hypothetical protein